MGNARWIIAAACALVLIGGAFGQDTSQSVIHISGQIFDPSGAVIPNTSVTLKRQDGPTAVGETKTDQRGRFQILARPAENYELHIAARGFNDVVRIIGARTDLDIGQVVLQLSPYPEPGVVVEPIPAGSITGRIYDELGTPVAYAKVTILSTDKLRAAEWAETSAVGAFALYSVPKEAFTILIEARGFRQRRVDVKPEAQRNSMDLGKIVLEVPDYIKHGDGIEVLGMVNPAPSSGTPIKTTVCELARQPANFNGQVVEVRATIAASEEASVLTDSTCSATILLTVADGITRSSEKQVHELTTKLKKRPTVTATITGRFEHAASRQFGHNVAFDSRLLMQSAAQIDGK